MEKPIYVLSGLGADERVFQKLHFGVPVTFVKWEVPEQAESIQAYAARIAANIPVTRPILVGLSFGGVVAIEIAKHIPVEKLMLIASVKTREELPFYYRLIGLLNLHRLVPATLLKPSNRITNWAFGAESIADKKLLKQILADTSPQFLKWAINQLLHWKNHIVPPNVLHIHGTSDRILPIASVDCDFVIEGGGHLMTLTKPEALSELLRQHL
ncbi:MAG: alpha/beta hydrolase [Sphingobacteriales bacterium]|nr:MAG: alpha/beta hydrolase [Sphingobacteriales bacterium]